MNINIKEHFSDREIKRLNKLPKIAKTGRWILTFGIIFLMVISILNLRIATTIGHRCGITGFTNILLVWYKGVEVGKTYQAYEIMIADRVSTAHLQIGLAIIFLIMLFSGWKDKCLLKCWKLLSSGIRDDKEPEISDNTA